MSRQHRPRQRRRSIARNYLALIEAEQYQRKRRQREAWMEERARFYGFSDLAELKDVASISSIRDESGSRLPELGPISSL